MQDDLHESLSALVPAYALGALDAETLPQVEAHLQTCDACRADLRAFRSVVEQLAFAAPAAEPDAALRARVLAIPRPAAAPVRPIGLRDRLRDLFGRPARRLALACAALLIVLLATLFWQQTGRTQITLTPSEAAPAADGVIAIRRDGRAATLTVHNLPVLDAAQQYQLWLVTDDVRDSGAVFSVDADGAASVPLAAPRPFTDYRRFGISIEPAGGSPGPTGARVLGGGS